MADFASQEETQRAIGHLLKLQDDPETLEGFFNKYPEANPFTSWPFLKEPTSAFLRYFEKASPETEAESALLPANSVDDLKLKELVEEFDREFAEAKQQRVTASTASKKFVNALVENAKKTHIPVPERGVSPAPQGRAGESVRVTSPVIAPPPPPTPALQEIQGAPVPPERIREIAVAAIQHPGPPEEKILFFHALTSFTSEKPAARLTELTGRATEVTEAAKVLSAPISTFPGERTFSAIATNSFQKGVAGVMDIVVPAVAKEAIINKILLQPLDTVVNHPEAVPQNIMETMADRWGTNFVNSAWFTKLRIDANRMIGEQKNAASLMNPFAKLASDVATTVFRGPPVVYVITYMETYRVTIPWSYTVATVSNYGNIALGYGRQILRMGANYVMKKAVKEGVKQAATKAAASTALKVGAEAVAGASTGGIAALAILAADFAKGLLNKGVGILKRMLFMGSSKNPEDNFILVAMVGLVVVFFIPVFPLINTPSFNQSMIDTSIATNMGGIGGGGPYEKGLNCLDPANSANPDCKLTQCQGDCAWPLETSTHACIIEGPLVGTHSGCRLSGIDFIGAGLFGAPVHTPYDGVVTAAVFGYRDNSGYFGNQDGGTYGNHVIVKTTNGGVLLFAHLRNIQVVQQGQQVAANTVLGFVDHTGYSGGVHLHYEDMGAGGCPRTGADINKYLPYPVPPCIDGADCETQLKALGHSSCL